MNEKIPLRLRKHIQTKIALTENFIKLMQEKNFDRISVKEIATTVPVSEVTFYNYFPKKSDIMVYFIQLTFVEIIWKIQNSTEKTAGLPAIRMFFDLIAEKIGENPKIIREITGFFLNSNNEMKFQQISEKEIKVVFGKYRGIEKIKTHECFFNFLKDRLQYAVEKKEISQNSDIKIAAVTLVNLVFSSTVTKNKIPNIELSEIYNKQLDIIFRGLDWNQNK